MLQIIGLKHNLWKHIRIADDIYFNNGTFTLLSSKWQLDFIDLNRIYNSYEKLNFSLKYKEHCFEIYNNEITYDNSIKKQLVNENKSLTYYIIKKNKNILLYYKNKQLLLIKDYKIIFANFIIDRKLYNLVINNAKFTIEHSLLSNNDNQHSFKLLYKNNKICFNYYVKTNKICNFLCYKLIEDKKLSYIYYYDLLNNTIKINVNNGKLYESIFTLVDQKYKISQLYINDYDLKYHNKNECIIDLLQNIQLPNTLKSFYKYLQDDNIIVNLTQEFINKSVKI